MILIKLNNFRRLTYYKFKFVMNLLLSYIFIYNKNINSFFKNEKFEERI